MTTTFAFIGFGEAGGLLAKGLMESGAKVAATYDILIQDSVKAGALRQKAAAAGIKAGEHPRDAVAGADIVISAVVSNQMVSAARNVAPYLKPGQIYMDINSASPMAKLEAAELVGHSGADYVEAAVMDLVPPHGHKVPMFLAGKAAARLEPILNGFGMKTQAIGEAIGTASTIKMVRSVFLKGFSAILLESLVAASKVGAQDKVLDSLQVTFPQLDWRQLSDYYAVRLIKHARRQAAEMYEVAETLEFLGLEPLTALATAKRLDWLADADLADGPGCDGYESLLAALNAAPKAKSA